MRYLIDEDTKTMVKMWQVGTDQDDRQGLWRLINELGYDADTEHLWTKLDQSKTIIMEDYGFYLMYQHNRRPDSWIKHLKQTVWPRIKSTVRHHDASYLVINDPRDVAGFKLKYLEFFV